MKIALAQLNPTVSATSLCRKFLQKSCTSHGAPRQKGADLAVFSERSLCGYLPMDLIERPHFIERNERELACLAKKLPIPSVVGYAARAKGPTGKSAANAAALLANGEIQFVQHKSCCSQRTMCSTNPAIFNPPPHKISVSFGGYKSRHHHLRGYLGMIRTYWAKPLL